MPLITDLPRQTRIDFRYYTTFAFFVQPARVSGDSTLDLVLRRSSKEEPLWIAGARRDALPAAQPTV